VAPPALHPAVGLLDRSLLVWHPQPHAAGSPAIAARSRGWSVQGGPRWSAAGLVRGSAGQTDAPLPCNAPLTQMSCGRQTISIRTDTTDCAREGKHPLSDAADRRAKAPPRGVGAARACRPLARQVRARPTTSQCTSSATPASVRDI
jgi:hypothetical protein